MGRRILVTGGAGFIGSNLVPYLLGEAMSDLSLEIDRVVTLDKLTYAGNAGNLDRWSHDSRHRFVEGDICDSGLVRELLEKENLDSIVHLAAESHVDRSIDASAAFIQTNLVGTHRLLEAARERWVALGKEDNFRFLHVSTDEVYGSLDDEAPPATESCAYAPNNPYSASKAGSDHLVRSWFQTYGLPTITTNSSNNYGPFQFPEKLIPLVIRKIQKGEPIPIYGDGSQVRDWIYVRDHCRALALTLFEGTPGGVYHIGGKSELKNIEVAKAVIDVMASLASEAGSVDPDSAIEFVDDRPGHDQRYAMDTSRIEQTLGWKPEESFSTGLRKTVQWYLDQEPWLLRIEDGTYRGERLGLT